MRCMLKFARLADSSTHDMLLELLELLVLACIATCSFPDEWAQLELWQLLKGGTYPLRAQLGCHSALLYIATYLLKVNKVVIMSM